MGVYVCVCACTDTYLHTHITSSCYYTYIYFSFLSNVSEFPATQLTLCVLCAEPLARWHCCTWHWLTAAYSRSFDGL